MRALPSEGSETASDEDAGSSLLAAGADEDGLITGVPLQAVISGRSFQVSCYVAGLALSDERLEAVSNAALPLDGDKTLFLNFDPQFYVACPDRLPAGTKLAVSYTYYPLQTGTDDTVFYAMRRGIELAQARAAAASAAADEQRALAQNYGEQLAGQERRALHLEEQLEAAITEKEHFRISYEAVLSSACWKLTAPIRALFGRNN